MAALITTSHGAARKLWDGVLHWQTFNPLFWRQHNLIGRDIGGEGDPLGDKPYFPIVEKQEFGKGKKGDRVTMHLINQLTGAGVGEGTARKDSGSNLVIRTLNVNVSTWFYESTIADYTASNQRVNFDLEAQAVKALGIQGARKIDDDLTYCYYYGYSKNNVDNAISTAVKHPNWLYANFAAPGWTAEKEGSLGTQHKFSLQVINAAKVYLSEKLKAVPIIWKGEACYLGVIHEFQANDLFSDPIVQTLLAQGQSRGDDNPLWSGAFIKYNGVFLHVNNNIDSANGTWSAADNVVDGVNIRRAIFTGGHAIGFGVGAEARRTILNEDDHQRNVSRGAELLYGATRLDWNTTDNQSSCIMSTSAAAPYGS